jgi:hypothetical protein
MKTPPSCPPHNGPYEYVTEIPCQTTKPLRTSEAKQVRRNPNYGYVITPCRQFLGVTSNLSD